MRVAITALAAGSLLAAGAIALRPEAAPPPAPAPSPALPGAGSTTAATPVAGGPCFEPNAGQWHDDARFRHRAGPATYFVTADGLAAVVRHGPLAEEGPTPEQSAWRMHLVGADASVGPVGERQLPGVLNYFLGNDPDRWRTGVSRFEQVRHRDAWAGIDVIYRHDGRGLAYDFEVAPWADPRAIALSFEGVTDLRIEADGGLSFDDDGIRVVHGAPTLLQPGPDGPVEVAGRFVLDAADRVRFEVPAWDRSLALLIDPSISYATFLGGDVADQAHGLHAQSDGNVHIAGYTGGGTFPTKDALTGTAPGNFDMFVTRLLSTGMALDWSTFIGGTGTDIAESIDVDGTGAVYVGGGTNSTDAPTANAIDSTFAAGDGMNAFLIKLANGGQSLTFATYLGGNTTGLLFNGTRIRAVDEANGNLYIAGHTYGNWATTITSAHPNALGQSDNFVACLPNDGSILTWSSYAGGSSYEEADVDIAVTATGVVYVVGYTYSTSLDNTSGRYQPSNAGSYDAYVQCFNAGGDTITWSTFIGGTGNDYATETTFDNNGNLWIAGWTNSTNFPLVGAFQSTASGLFLCRLDPTGTTLMDGSYLGGTEFDHGPHGLVSDTTGRAYVFGRTDGTFPVTEDALQSTYGGGAADFFLAIVSGDGSTLEYATYLGGVGHENIQIGSGNLLGRDDAGNLYMAGIVDSFLGTVPISDGAFQTSWGGDTDALVVKVAPDGGGGGGGGDVMLDLLVKKGSIKDSSKAGKDKAVFTCDLGTSGAEPGDVFDPMTQALGFMVDFDGDGTINLQIPADDPLWKVNKPGTTMKWKSAKGVTPKVLVLVKPSKGLMKVKVVKEDLENAAVTPVEVTVTLGQLTDTDSGTWTEKKPGVLQIKQ